MGEDYKKVPHSPPPPIPNNTRKKEKNLASTKMPKKSALRDPMKNPENWKYPGSKSFIVDMGRPSEAGASGDDSIDRGRFFPDSEKGHKNSHGHHRQELENNDVKDNQEWEFDEDEDEAGRLYANFSKLEHLPKEENSSIYYPSKSPFRKQYETAKDEANRNEIQDSRFKFSTMLSLGILVLGLILFFSLLGLFLKIAQNQEIILSKLEAYSQTNDSGVELSQPFNSSGET